MADVEIKFTCVVCGKVDNETVDADSLYAVKVKAVNGGYDYKGNCNDCLPEWVESLRDFIKKERNNEVKTIR